jgi:hypothetical protein
MRLNLMRMVGSYLRIVRTPTSEIFDRCRKHQTSIQLRFLPRKSSIQPSSSAFLFNIISEQAELGSRSLHPAHIPDLHPVDYFLGHTTTIVNSCSLFLSTFIYASQYKHVSNSDIVAKTLLAVGTTAAFPYFDNLSKCKIVFSSPCDRAP